MKMATTAKAALAAAVAFAAMASSAGPARDPVAEGYIDWDGVNPKNFLAGRMITPSDLRHRVVVYLVVDAEKFTNDKVPDFSELPLMTPIPASHMTQWETEEMPRDKILVVSVRNVAKKDAASFASVLKAPKGSGNDVARLYVPWTESRIPFYKDVVPLGAAEIPAENLPYVAVYGNTGTEPVYTKANWSAADSKATRAAIKKASASLGEWSRPLGVAEPQFFPKVAVDFAKGKPAQGMLSVLKGGIKSKNPEQAKESQVMFDAINQYKSELMFRIMVEFATAPARAYYDFQMLVKYFPAERKNLQDIDAKFKANKEIGALGKMLEKVMLWSREDYVCKNAGEAKKNVQELQKMKKALDSLAESKNAQIQGEAMLFQSQIDALIDMMPMKVPQK